MLCYDVSHSWVTRGIPLKRPPPGLQLVLLPRLSHLLHCNRSQSCEGITPTVGAMCHMPQALPVVIVFHMNQLHTLQQVSSC